MITTDALREVVSEAGYVATVSGDLVLFKSEGTSFRFETFPDDADYARLILTYKLPNRVGIKRLLETANERNRAAKAVKTVVYTGADAHVAFTVEMFGKPETWAASIDRLLLLLRRASDLFFESARSAVAS